MVDSSEWMPFAAVAVGGFIGAVLRYLTDTAVFDSLPGTLIVNTIGCFFLGIFMYESMYLAGSPGPQGSSVRSVSSGRLPRFRRLKYSPLLPGRSSVQ